MPNVNKLHFIGNLTRDPELIRSNNGTSIVNFGMASNRYFRKPSGERGQEVTFIEVAAFSRLADNLYQFCKKGTPLYIEGRLKTDSWADKSTGAPRSRIRVIAEEFQLLSRKPEDVPADEEYLEVHPDEDIPF